jgi:sugar lactone lactonase YvrE
MRESDIRCVWQAAALLGEGPLWCSDEDCILWVDIKRPSINRFWLDGRRDVVLLQEEIGCLVRRRAGGLVAALRSGFAFVDLSPLTIRPICDPEPMLPGNRFNDGKCDPTGRFWAATMDDSVHQPTGSIWRLSADLTISRMAQGFIVGNGFGWSPDHRVMYFSDSENRQILTYDFDADAGSIRHRRVFVEIPPDAGFPDGLTVDAAGHIWSCHWDGWRVTRYRPDGSIERVLPMPVPRPTSLVFGGTRLDRLYVTSASIGLSPEQRLAAPLSGGLFEIDVGIRGLPEFTFDG